MFIEMLVLKSVERDGQTGTNMNEDLLNGEQVDVLPTGV